MNEATREDLMDIARNAAEYRKKLSTPRTKAGQALLARSIADIRYEDDMLGTILAIEAEAAQPVNVATLSMSHTGYATGGNVTPGLLPSVERLAEALHDIEPNLTCIATRNIPASFDCTKPDIDRATAILAALGPLPDASERLAALRTWAQAQLDEPRDPDDPDDDWGNGWDDGYDSAFQAVLEHIDAAHVEPGDGT